MTWDLAIGQEDTRTAIQARHGGSRSRGISAPRREPPADIMLWWHPKAGADHGYADGWNEAGDVFLFTGSGQVGDQTFDNPHAENRRLRDHAITGDHVRLLRYIRKNTVRYEGELVLAPSDPWFWLDSRDRHLNRRRVIQFRLVTAGAARLDAASDREQFPSQEHLETVPASPSRTDVERLATPTFQRLLQVRHQLIHRRELVLLHEFKAWLHRRDFEMHAMRLPHDASGQGLRVDGFVPAASLLIEAKASAARESIRLAIGQLLDYARWFPKRPQLAILVPSRPAEDMTALLDELGIAAFWRQGRDGFTCRPGAVLGEPSVE